MTTEPHMLETENIEMFGSKFRVVVPASIGLGRHSTQEFSDHEPCMERWVSGIRAGDVVIDAGAGFGNYSLPALERGAYAICYEPHDEHATILRTNIAINGWLGRCLVRELGLWRVSSPVTKAEDLYPQGILAQLSTPLDMPHRSLDDDMKMFGLVPPKPARKGWPKDIEAVVGSRVHLKLDTEGTELAILQGGMKLLETYHPRIVVENHEGVSSDPNCEVSRYPERVKSSENMERILMSLGYSIEVFRCDVTRRWWVCTPNGWS